MKISKSMSPQSFIKALQDNDAVVFFPSRKALNKAIKDMRYPDGISYNCPAFKLYSYRNIPLMYEHKII